jgi:hypothetical protein
LIAIAFIGYFAQEFSNHPDTVVDALAEDEKEMFISHT